MISAVLLAHNDGSIIARAIESVSWCDEVVVIDDDSIDETVEVSKKMGATVYTHSLNNDFASQRNFGLSKALGDWVFFLDSDEVVSKELSQEILQMDTSKSGYFIRRADFMWGRELTHGESADVRLLRLAKKGSGTWERSVHEVWNIEGETGTFLSPLTHFPHPDVAQFMDEVNKYSTMNADILYAAKAPSKGWHVIGYPVAKFVRNYVWLLGFLDGMPGLIVAIMMSFHSFLTRGKLYMQYHKQTVLLP